MSIPPTFYEQHFHMKVFRVVFLHFQFLFVIFCEWNCAKKPDRKMLVKLTTDRKKLEVYLCKNTKLRMPKLPDGDSIFNYNVNVHNGKWFHWNSLVTIMSHFKTVVLNSFARWTSKKR